MLTIINTSAPVVCNTCGRRDDAPYRVYDDRGNVVQGCVDECHTGRLVTPSASAAWHGRTEAKKIRRALRIMLTGK